jgi:hypothetical protein
MYMVHIIHRVVTKNKIFLVIKGAYEQMEDSCLYVDFQYSITYCSTWTTQLILCCNLYQHKIGKDYAEFCISSMWISEDDHFLLYKTSWFVHLASVDQILMRVRSCDKSSICLAVLPLSQRRKTMLSWARILLLWGWMRTLLPDQACS